MLQRRRRTGDFPRLDLARFGRHRLPIDRRQRPPIARGRADHLSARELKSSGATERIGQRSCPTSTEVAART